MMVVPIGQLMRPEDADMKESLLNDEALYEFPRLSDHIEFHIPRQPIVSSKLSSLFSKVIGFKPGPANIVSFLGTREILRIIFDHIESNGGSDIIARCRVHSCQSRDDVITSFYRRYSSTLNLYLNEIEIALLLFGRDFRLSPKTRSAVRLVQQLARRNLIINSQPDSTCYFGQSGTSSEDCQTCCCIVTLCGLALLSTFLPYPLK